MAWNLRMEVSLIKKDIQFMNIQASLYPSGETMKIVHNCSEISKGNSETIVGTSSSPD